MNRRGFISALFAAAVVAAVPDWLAFDAATPLEEYLTEIPEYDGIRFIFSSGDITSGTFTLYGLPSQP